MSSANRLIVSILVVAGLAVAFWMLALSPKQEKADELSAEVETLNVSLSQAQSTVAAAEEAKREFPTDYRQLIVLGEAVPGGDETSSLLVELNKIAAQSEVEFQGIQLNSNGEGEAVAAPVPAPPAETPEGEPSSAVPAAATIPPTEAAAALMPLGASIGPAGLGVMPYNLTFSGDFFEIADFVKGLDSLVDTGTAGIGVEGRLLTISSFTLDVASSEGESTGDLNASFEVTTYLTPPDQGVTAGASPAEPAPTSAPVAESSGGDEESESTEVAAAR
jgi:Tfp pilus assembly protein PilO